MAIHIDKIIDQVIANPPTADESPHAYNARMRALRARLDAKEDEPPFYFQDLDSTNGADLYQSAMHGELRAIVSEADGGIIAYAIGPDHAVQIVAALLKSN